jgi:hypothetical protein
MHPFVAKRSADGGYQGAQFRKGLATILGDLAIEIVRRPDHPKGFVALPRRWIVERTLAWLSAVEGHLTQSNALAVRLAPPERHRSQEILTWTQYDVFRTRSGPQEGRSPAAQRRHRKAVSPTPFE